MNHEQRFVLPSETNQSSGPQGWLHSRRVIILCATVGIIGAVFLSGHSNHVIAVLPYLLLLACPFMHFFMRCGHGHSGKESNDGRNRH